MKEHPQPKSVGKTDTLQVVWMQRNWLPGANYMQYQSWYAHHQVYRSYPTPHYPTLLERAVFLERTDKRYPNRAKALSVTLDDVHYMHVLLWNQQQDLRVKSLRHLRLDHAASKVQAQG